jgi:hypothetical protein
MGAGKLLVCDYDCDCMRLSVTRGRTLVSEAAEANISASSSISGCAESSADLQWTYHHGLLWGRATGTLLDDNASGHVPIKAMSVPVYRNRDGYTWSRWHGTIRAGSSWPCPHGTDGRLAGSMSAAHNPVRYNARRPFCLCNSARVLRKCLPAGRLRQRREQYIHPSMMPWNCIWIRLIGTDRSKWLRETRLWMFVA